MKFDEHCPKSIKIAQNAMMDESFTYLQKSINFSMTSLFTTGGIRGNKISIDKFLPRSFNMGIKKDAFEKVNGFSDIRQYGEDLDYMVVPKYTMAGYTVMMKEIADQIQEEKITHIILQAGVGGMAAAMVAGIARYLNYVPTIIVVEPDSAACVMESIKTGKIEKIDIKRESLMGGMSCGEVSLVPWEILKNSVKYCVSLPDDDIAKTMKLLGNSSFSDVKIIAGENSAPGVISLITSCEDQAIKEKLDFNEKSNVLVFGCEGDTDQEMYQKLINQN